MSHGENQTIPADRLTAAMVWDGRSNRREGVMLLIAYGGVVAGFLVAGNR